MQNLKDEAIALLGKTIENNADLEVCQEAGLAAANLGERDVVIKIIELFNNTKDDKERRKLGDVLSYIQVKTDHIKTLKDFKVLGKIFYPSFLKRVFVGTFVSAILCAFIIGIFLHLGSLFSFMFIAGIFGLFVPISIGVREIFFPSKKFGAVIAGALGGLLASIFASIIVVLFIRSFPAEFAGLSSKSMPSLILITFLYMVSSGILLGVGMSWSAIPVSKSRSDIVKTIGGGIILGGTSLIIGCALSRLLPSAPMFLKAFLAIKHWHVIIAGTVIAMGVSIGNAVKIRDRAQLLFQHPLLHWVIGASLIVGIAVVSYVFVLRKPVPELSGVARQIQVDGPGLDGIITKKEQNDLYQISNLSDSALLKVDVHPLKGSPIKPVITVCDEKKEKEFARCPLTDSKDSFTFATPRNASTLFLKVKDKGEQPGLFNSYRLSVRSVNDPEPVSKEASPIVILPESIVKGAINTANDVDYYQFFSSYAEDWDWFSIEMSTAIDGVKLSLLLSDSNHKELCQMTNSKRTQRLRPNSIFYIDVYSEQEPGDGMDNSYQLSISKADVSSIIKILAFKYYIDKKEYQNALDAVGQRDEDFVIHEMGETFLSSKDIEDQSKNDSNNAKLNEILMKGIDVFLIPNQPHTGEDTLKSIGEVFSTTLNEFIQKGGIVVSLTEETFLIGAGLLSGLTKDQPETEFIVKLPKDDIASGVDNKFSINDPNASEWDTDAQWPSDVQLVIVNEDNHAVVLKRQVGSGFVILIGYPFFERNRNFDGILANSLKLRSNRSKF